MPPNQPPGLGATPPPSTTPPVGHRVVASAPRNAYQATAPSSDRSSRCPNRNGVWPPIYNLDYVIDHVARRSMKEVEGGYAWKFDRRLFESFGGSMRGIAKPYLPQIRCRFALLRSEHGLISPEVRTEMYEALGRVAPVVELPQTGHHPMLDQPLVLLTALRALLADWDHSEPHRVD